MKQQGVQFKKLFLIFFLQVTSPDSFQSTEQYWCEYTDFQSHYDGILQLYND